MILKMLLLTLIVINLQHKLNQIKSMRLWMQAVRKAKVIQITVVKKEILFNGLGIKLHHRNKKKVKN